MSCCSPAAGYAAAKGDPAADPAELRLASRVVGEGLRQTDLSVPGIHCGGCIQVIERALGALPGVDAARVNLSTKRVAIRWREAGEPPAIVQTLQGLGYAAHLLDETEAEADRTLAGLIRALAVAGFGASNIMLLSVSVWAGAEPQTRDAFHWLSALIALVVLTYSGRVFFASAWRVLRLGRTNMDVPISIGVLLAFGLSLYETLHRGEHAYFDAAVTLLFFLLIGRTLDHMMRERARVAVKGLARLAPRGALTLQPDGSRLYLPVADLRPGATILLAAGERVPVDARVLNGRSEMDASLLTGESLPQPAAEGMLLRAGMLNLTAPLTIAATAEAQDSFIAEMIRMMEAAEAGRSAYRRIADRASSLYAPVVHATALATFVGWLIATGDIHRSITIAIAVLIITCPCALGLAVPMVQIVAARRLFERGIMLKDGAALERLAEIDAVAFDKTGTLTLGRPRLLHPQDIEPSALRLAAAMAEQSRHPYSRAIAAAAPPHGGAVLPSMAISEIPGCGVEARLSDGTWRLGRPDWAVPQCQDAAMPEANVVLARDGRHIAAFRFEDEMRDGMEAAVAALGRAGLPVEILSGDREAAVAPIARRLRVDYRAGMTPAGKTARIEQIGAAGRKVLMVGDGLNDAPALMAAHASMAPASAADIGRQAADLVFLHETLHAVPDAICIAGAAAALVRQNLAFAVLYNLVAVPVAVLGHVTPLVAAVAMSLSSIIVVGNALRLRAGRPLAVPARRPAQTLASRGA